MKKIVRKTSKFKAPKRALTEPLYVYTEKKNAQHARGPGAALFGSYSCYINALIARDRGAKPRLGIWKAPQDK